MTPAPKVIAVTIGDPWGIGPEIVYKSLSTNKIESAIVLIGNRDYFHYDFASDVEDPDNLRAGNVYFLNLPTKEIDADPSFAFVRKGVDLCLEGRAAALVTAPISKERWAGAGIHFRGHTDYLAHRCRVKNYAMFFWSPEMMVALYTVHIPLREVFGSIQKGRIVSFTRFLDSELSRLFGRRFTFIFCGLNPHSGEGGILGEEEKREIIPAVRELGRHLDVLGPIPADVAFLKSREVKHAVMVAWYHDQGLIPFKLQNIFSGVNLTLGLPFVRTSPDHGTAFNIAGKNIADPASMTQALLLADRLSPTPDLHRL